MQLSEFNYYLPETLIAQTPPPVRGASRLLVVRGQSRDDRQFAHLPALLQAGDILVCNNTRVIPARLHGHKASGGKVEVLVERILDTRRARVQLRASKSPRLGARLHLAGVWADVVARHDSWFELEFQSEEPLSEWLERVGTLPLPPYIQRAPDAQDLHRYQTIYARHAGAVAAPTAGLHFSPELFAALALRGIERVEVTLHVGAGTFQPVRVDDIRQHVMHPESGYLTPEVAAQLNAAKVQGRRIIAVGTTSARLLESAADAQGRLQPFAAETRLFITPGYRFNVVDGLITNFHLPQSTLLMLVCALGGQASVLAAYQHAVQQCYRFFSYGDAMLLWPQPDGAGVV